MWGTCNKAAIKQRTGQIANIFSSCICSLKRNINELSFSMSAQMKGRINDGGGGGGGAGGGGNVVVVVVGVVVVFCPNRV